MSAGTVHVVGAGLAGLSAAVALAQRGRRVAVHEALDHAGGRCRSYHDHATGLLIDNGNHLLLSGNRAARSFLRAIGTEDGLVGPRTAQFPFIDLKDGARWTLRINDGRVPWWVFAPSRRVPGTRAGDYLSLGGLLRPGAGKTVCEAIRCAGALYERLLRPVLLAALNTDPQQGSAALAGAVVRETLAVGGTACRPLIAREGLSAVFIEPALAFLERHGVPVRFGRELHSLKIAGDLAAALDFGTEVVPLAHDDAVILAVPAAAAASLVPDLAAPSEFRAIVNAHFAVDPPRDFAPIIGVVNGLTEWLFAFPGRLSVTISAADRLLGAPREDLAAQIWHEVAAIGGLDPKLPPWQIVRERRATFAATPQQDALRPGAATAWNNLVLAGDWTQTGLPATIEGAVRSGHRAAELVGGR
jgi:squalene-associated FAD-dependent desaturase